MAASDHSEVSAYGLNLKKNLGSHFGNLKTLEKSKIILGHFFFTPRDDNLILVKSEKYTTLVKLMKIYFRNGKGIENSENSTLSNKFSLIHKIISFLVTTSLNQFFDYFFKNND